MPPKKKIPVQFKGKIQSKAAAAAEDKKTPGKHAPYSPAEAKKEAFWQMRAKMKPSAKKANSKAIMAKMGKK